MRSLVFQLHIRAARVSGGFGKAQLCQDFVRLESGLERAFEEIVGTDGAGVDTPAVTTAGF